MAMILCNLSAKWFPCISTVARRSPKLLRSNRLGSWATLYKVASSLVVRSFTSIYLSSWSHQVPSRQCKILIPLSSMFAYTKFVHMLECPQEVVLHDLASPDVQHAWARSGLWSQVKFYHSFENTIAYYHAGLSLVDWWNWSGAGVWIMWLAIMVAVHIT